MESWNLCLGESWRRRTTVWICLFVFTQWLNWDWRYPCVLANKVVKPLVRRAAFDSDPPEWSFCLNFCLNVQEHAGNMCYSFFLRVFSDMTQSYPKVSFVYPLENNIQTNSKTFFTHSPCDDSSQKQQWSINPELSHKYLTFIPNFMLYKIETWLRFFLTLHLYFSHTDTHGASGSNKGEFHIK